MDALRIGTKIKISFLCEDLEMFWKKCLEFQKTKFPKLFQNSKKKKSEISNNKSQVSETSKKRPTSFLKMFFIKLDWKSSKFSRNFKNLSKTLKFFGHFWKKCKKIKKEFQRKRKSNFGHWNREDLVCILLLSESTHCILPCN